MPALYSEALPTLRWVGIKASVAGGCTYRRLPACSRLVHGDVRLVRAARGGRGWRRRPLRDGTVHGRYGAPRFRYDGSDVGEA